MKKIKVFINGFGRIGRHLFRILLDNDKFDIVGINDIEPIENFIFLLKNDSTYGKYNKDILLKNNILYTGSHKIKLFSKKDLLLENLEVLSIEILFQCSGIFLSYKKNKPFLEKKIKKIIVSAPAIDNLPTFIMGFNHNNYNNEKIISTSSCSTNAIAPILHLLDKNYSIDSVCISMVHSYTSNQYLLDNNGKVNKRQLRSATQNILPLKSSATVILKKLFPAFFNKIYTKSIRVPLSTVTLYDFTVFVKKNITKDEINKIFIDISENDLYGIIDTSNLELVSSDFIKNKHSIIVDLNLTEVLDSRCIKILAWQDNEYGYAYQLMNIAKHISK